jgi:hypothetical protein
MKIRMGVTFCKYIGWFALFEEPASYRVQSDVRADIARFLNFPRLCSSHKQEIIVFSLCFQAILDTEQHSISYTLSRTQAVIVEYMPDEETDMFQVRSAPSQTI